MEQYTPLLYLEKKHLCDNSSPWRRSVSSQSQSSEKFWETDREREREKRCTALRISSCTRVVLFLRSWPLRSLFHGLYKTLVEFPLFMKRQFFPSSTLHIFSPFIYLNSMRVNCQNVELCWSSEMALNGAQSAKNIWKHSIARKKSTDLDVFSLLKELFLYNRAEGSVLGTRHNKKLKE